MTLLHDDELADFRAAIAKYALKEAEFVLEEGKIDGPADGGVGPLVGSVIVTYKPTTVSKKYNIGHMSQWPFLFETDLGRGAFQA